WARGRVRRTEPVLYPPAKSAATAARPPAAGWLRDVPWRRLYPSDARSTATHQALSVFTAAAQPGRTRRRTVDNLPDSTFGFGFGGAPDPNDPQQMQQFMSQLQQMFTAPSSGGPVNWDLARQVAQAHLTGSQGMPAGMFGFGLPNLMGMAAPAAGE